MGSNKTQLSHNGLHSVVWKKHAFRGFKKMSKLYLIDMSGRKPEWSTFRGLKKTRIPWFEKRVKLI
jgi:hypothetical protein